MKKYAKLIAILICVTICNAHAYWGQSYIESALSAVRTYWNKRIQPFFIKPTVYSQNTSTETANFNNLDLVAYIAYKNKKDKELAQEIAEGQAANRYDKEIIIDPQQNIKVSLTKHETGDLIMTIADDEISVDISDPQEINSMTVDKIKEIAINEKIRYSVAFAQDASKALSATYIRSIPIDPSEKIKMQLTKAKGGRLIMKITNGDKEIEITNPDQMKRMTYAEIKKLF